MARIFLSRYSLAVYSVVTTIAFLLVAVIPYVQVNWYQDKNHVAMAQANAVANLGCGDLNSYNAYSRTYKVPTSSWATNFMMNSESYSSNTNMGITNSPALNQLIDINGDGLPDYVYSSHGNSYINNVGYMMDIKDCVYLNTGNGWQRVYGCVIKFNQDNAADRHYRYYGDCAA